MAIDVDWTGVEANPYRIYIPKADTTLVQASPEIRSLDVDAFRLELKDLEADVEGMMWTDTHKHTQEGVLSGITYARRVEILAPYTVEFEDGQYTVQTPGANHNIADRKIQNQVGIVVQNSAGLVVVQGTVGADDIWNADLSTYTIAGSAGAVLQRTRQIVGWLLGLV